MEKYSWIVNGEAQKQVEEYMEETHTFSEYCEVSDIAWNMAAGIIEKMSQFSEIVQC